jgi:hypothetical protein
LDDLMRVAPPPAQPVACAGDWDAVQRELGTALPADYRGLIERYGYGTFRDFLHLFAPFVAACPMTASVRRTLEADRELAASFPEDALPLFPDPGGLLPWASTDNGDQVYFRTSGAPDAWTVVVRNPRDGHTYSHPGGSVDFLAAWLGGALGLAPFGEDAATAAAAAWFEEWRDLERETVHLEVVAAVSGESAGGYAERLAILQRELAPSVARGAFGDFDNERRQVHFRATADRWHVTYDSVYGHNIRLAVPRGTLAQANERLARVIEAMGCRIRLVQPARIG